MEIIKHDEADVIKENEPNRVYLSMNETIDFFLYFEQFTASKFQRFLIFLSFFIIVVLLIICCAKVHKQIKLIQTRFDRYGYFINARFEAAFYERLSRLYIRLVFFVEVLDMFKRKLNFFTASFENTELPVKRYLKDTGHVNEVFDDSNEIYTSSPESIILAPLVDTSSHRRSHIHRYLETKRINAFRYSKIKNIRSHSTEDLYGATFKKTPSLLRRVRNKLRPSNLINGSVFKSIKSMISMRKTRQENKMKTNDENCVSFEIPTILVTDTSKMFTRVVDLEKL